MRYGAFPIHLVGFFTGPSTPEASVAFMPNMQASVLVTWTPGRPITAWTSGNPQELAESGCSWRK